MSWMRNHYPNGFHNQGAVVRVVDRGDRIELGINGTIDDCYIELEPDEARWIAEQLLICSRLPEAIDDREPAETAH